MARKKANIHYIYKTTCDVTGRWYIGMHSTSNLEDGYVGSGTILRRSIRKYGIENHTKEILEFLPTREELVLREVEIVNKELISDGLCMNLKEGGQGGFSNKEHMIKCSKAGNDAKRIKLKNDLEYRKNHIIRFSKGLMKYNASGKNDSPRFSGKSHSEETKRKMSESSKNTGLGETNSQYGTCWITKDGTNKKIKKQDLETYLNEGWVKGRK
jgi:hypothetical protein